VLHERHRLLPPGQAGHQLVADAEQDVVPPVGGQHQRQCGQVGVLLLEEGAHERLVDIDLGGGHVLGGHDAGP
jgi:hypothetical protein